LERGQLVEFLSFRGDNCGDHSSLSSTSAVQI